ncbi:hypothetical protein ACE103_05295 [Bradyrhizobium sp. ma5]|uniref:hypothetical protein n=1 Tax=Bradyrhizobium sp. ma5 TaxID=3344828 RepID=UPI0035D48395
MERRDTDGIDALVFPKVFATRRPSDIQEHGDEFKARNILTAIDKMTVEHPNIRRTYDDLSEICHPNSLGVFSHFADTFDDKRALFDDGQDMTEAAYTAFYSAASCLWLRTQSSARSKPLSAKS